MSKRVSKLMHGAINEMKEKAATNDLVNDKKKKLKKLMSWKVIELLGGNKMNPGNHPDLYTQNLKDLIHQISEDKIMASVKVIVPPKS